MKPWKTFVLAFLLLMVGAYIRYVELPQEAKRKEEELFLEGVSERSLRSLGINRKGEGFSFKNEKPVDPLQKEAGEKGGADVSQGWILDGLPAGTNLDPAALRTLLSAVTTLKLGDAIPPEEVGTDLKVFGLDNPAVTVRIGLPTGERVLMFGKRSEFIGKRYVKVADRGLFMVDDALFSAADKERDSFRQKSPISFDLADASFLELNSSDGVVRLEKAEGEEWKVVAPLNAKADQQFVSDFVRRIRSLRAKEFIDPPQAEQLAEFGLDRPDVTVTIGGEKRKLEIKLAVKVTGGSEGEGKSDVAMYFWFNESPSVYKIEGNQINLFRLPAESFRDKHVIAVTRTAVSRVEVASEGAAPRVFEKGATGWKLDGAEAVESEVESYVDALTELTVEKFATLEDAREPFGAPALRLTVREGDKDSAWEIGSESKLQLGKLHPLRRVDGAVLGYITPEQLKQIIPKDDSSLKKKVTGALTNSPN